MASVHSADRSADNIVQRRSRVSSQENGMLKEREGGREKEGEGVDGEREGDRALKGRVKRNLFDTQNPSTATMMGITL